MLTAPDATGPASPRLHSTGVPDAIDVLFPLPLGPLSYLAPLQTGEGETAVGRRVVVPWQSSVRVGLVAASRAVDAGRGLELRHALRYLDEAPFLGRDQLRAVDAVARATGVPAGLVLATLGVPGLTPELAHEVRLHEAPAAAELFGELPTGRWLPGERLGAKELDVLRAQGLVDEAVRVVRHTRRVLVPRRRADADLDGERRANQRRALERLHALGEADSAAALARDADVPESAVRALVEKGYAAYVEVEAPLPPLPGPPLLDDRLEDPPPGAAVTGGDGYVAGGSRRARLSALLPTLASDLAAGRSVVVVAPENVLVREAAGLLATRLPVRYLTGEATDEQREALFAELPAGGPVVLVGSHVALLAPVPSLGRIVVLEAGNQTHKLRSGGRLWVPKAAQRVAAAAGASLTLTDVAPSPELLAMGGEAGGTLLPLPRLRVHVADMSGSAGWPLHPDLLLTFRQVVQRERQAIVLAPRRGFSGAYGCQNCGWQAPCPNCDLTLRFHRDEGRLRCHQCGHDQPLPQACPQCGHLELGALKGAGTQWVLSQLERAAPGFPGFRFDADRRDDLSPLYAGEPGVIVGTTAVLRLAPLPELSLVAVTLFDVHLALADFRAEHEALRMLLQVAELATGRRPLLLVQTFAPGAPALRAVASAAPDVAVEALLAAQLERRRRFGYPPFTTLAKVQVTARDRSGAHAAAHAVADRLRVAGARDDEVLGPEAAPVARVKGRYTFQLLIRAWDEARLEGLLAAVPDRLPGARVAVDVDPVDVGELLE